MQLQLCDLSMDMLSQPLENVWLYVDTLIDTRLFLFSILFVLQRTILSVNKLWRIRKRDSLWV